MSYYQNDQNNYNQPAQDDGALDWESEISQESNFTIIPAGEYPFEIVNFEKAYFNGSDNMGACPMAIITLRLNSGNGQEVEIKDRLYLHKKAEWRIAQLLLSIGMKKHGEPARARWTQMIGMRGRAKIIVRQYNGKEYNNVDAYLEAPQQFATGAF